MVFYNYKEREITGKIVYCGPRKAGKSTTLRYIFDRVDAEARGKLVTVASGEGSLMYFDFHPVNVGEVTGMRIRFQLMTASGSISAEETWDKVLQGVDAVVFVADSGPGAAEMNRGSYEALVKELSARGPDPDSVPLMFLYNKRDLETARSIEQLNSDLNMRRVPWFATSSLDGEGILESFQSIGRMLLVEIGRRYREDLLRRKREQIQKAQEALGSGEAADPDEETRSIRMPIMADETTRLPNMVPTDTGRLGQVGARRMEEAEWRVRADQGETTTSLDQWEGGAEASVLKRELAELSSRAIQILEAQADLMRRIENLRNRLDG